MRFCYYCLLIAITNISSVSYGFRSLMEKSLGPNNGIKERISIRISTCGSTNMRKQILFAPTSSRRDVWGKREPIRIFSSHRDGEESVGMNAKPYFMKEIISVEEAVVNISDSNNSLLNEEISGEETSADTSDQNTSNLNTENQFDVNLTKHVLSEVADVSALVVVLQLF
jgi:hypothetical protein